MKEKIVKIIKSPRQFKNIVPILKIIRQKKRDILILEIIDINNTKIELR